MKQKAKWALLTSGYGRGAIVILELFAAGKLDNAEINLVIYDSEPSGAAKLAQDLDINSVRIQRNDFENRSSFEQAIKTASDEAKVDFVFMLGFGYILKHNFLEAYLGKIVNIHPSLLPVFKGKNAIQQALNYGVKVCGMTTHFIDDKLDEGQIIEQLVIRIADGDTFKTLDQRYLANFPEILGNTIRKVSNSILNH